MFQNETDFSLAIIRTQLFNPADLDNVKKIQAGYRALPLSKFQNKPAPASAPAIAWPKIDKKSADADPFGYRNFVLTLCPPASRSASSSDPFRHLSRKGPSCRLTALRTGLTSLEQR